MGTCRFGREEENPRSLVRLALSADICFGKLSLTDMWSFRMNCLSVIARAGVATGAFLAIAMAGLDGASAEVATVAVNGFSVRVAAEIAAPPAKVYAALVK